MKIIDKIIIIWAIIIIAIALFLGCTEKGRDIWRRYHCTMDNNCDNITNKERVEAEEACRAMIAAWETDALTYKQNKDTNPAEAEQARERANITAASYNDFMMVNGYLWDETLPDGIYGMIEPIE